MPARTEQLVPHIERLAAAADPASDADLLERYIQQHDEAAFACLVGRYGPMVLLVCRRMLADAGAAEDCLQATFLVLARKAGSIRRRESLAAFLHAVACRVARKALAAGLRRPIVEPLNSKKDPVDPHPDPLAELTARELMTALDEEVARLPEPCRLSVVLCCLEGLSLEEAARRLGWSPGSVKGRLERGRKRLHDRLVRRGLTLGTALAAAEVSRAITSAPALLATATMRSALALTAGHGVAGVSARVAALAEGALPAWRMLTRLTMTALLLSVGVAAGASLLLHRPEAKSPGIEPFVETGSLSRNAVKPAAEQRKQALDDQGEPLPAGALARMGSVRFCSGHTVQSVAFSPDRRTLASGTNDGTVWLWEIATGKKIRILNESQTPVQSIAFSPDGKLLACRGQNTGIGLWQTADGKLVRRFGLAPLNFPPSHMGSFAYGFRIAFSPDGKALAAASGDLTGKDCDIRLWDVQTGKELRRFRGHKEAVRTFAFAPDGKTFASGSKDKTIFLWDPATGNQLHCLRGTTGEILALAYSPNGKALASGGEDGMIRFWNSAGKELRKVPVSLTVRSIEFIDDGKLAWGDEKGLIHLMDLATDKELHRLGQHPSWVSGLCCSPDDKILASLGDGQDHAVYLWKADTGKRLSPQLDAHQGRVESVVFTPDGKTLVSSGWDATIRFWDPATGKERRRFEHAGGPMALSPDGKTLVVAVQDNVRFLDAASGKELRRFEQVGSGNTASVAIAPDGKTVVMGKNRFDGQFRGFSLHDAATGKELRLFSGHSYNVKSVAFSPDGKKLASGAEDKTMRLWETATAKELFRLQHDHWVEKVAFSSDGEMLVSVDGRSVRLWQPSTGKELRRFDVQYGVSGVAFSPDGKMLASGEYELAIKGWVIRVREVATGKEIYRWTGHRNLVSSLTFSPDGRTLASSGWDTLILMWDVTGLQKVRPAAQLVRNDLDELWEHLASEDVPQAYRAVWKLASSPEQSVPFLASRLHPAPAADARRLSRMVSELDSDQFALRESATAELEKLGEAAEAALRKALEGNPSLEVRTRIGRLLKKLEAEAKSQERLRLSRALQVLEHSGTVAARVLLKRLAGGAAQAWQSREAKAALRRLDRRALSGSRRD